MRRRLMLVAILCLPLAGQTPTATLVGCVLDRAGASVPGAEVQIRSEATNEIRRTSADSGGEFTVPNLAPGAYTVRLEVSTGSRSAGGDR